MYVSTLSALIPCVFAIWYIRDIYSKNKPFIVLLITTFIVEVVAINLSVRQANNMWLYYSFTVVEFALLTASLQRLQYQKVPVKITGTLILLLLACTIADAFYLSGLNMYNSFSRSVECLLLIGLSLFGFYDLIKNHSKQNTHLSSSPLFWLALAVLTYYGGQLIPICCY